LRLLDSIEESLRHPIEETQLKAVSAIKALTHEYFPVGENGEAQKPFAFPVPHAGRAS
jgi:hypothetical protein